MENGYYGSIKILSSVLMKSIPVPLPIRPEVKKESFVILILSNLRQENREAQKIPVTKGTLMFKKFFCT